MEGKTKNESMENRVIKFRAWDEKIKQFHYWDSKSQPHDNVFWAMVKNNNMPTTEWTGLQDKNGKEIYEGDIVTFLFKSSIEDEGTTAVWEVYWHDGGFSYGKKSEKYAMSVYQEWASRVTVIGNQFETPELLTQLSL